MAIMYVLFTLRAFSSLCEISTVTERRHAHKTLFAGDTVLLCGVFYNFMT